MEFEHLPKTRFTLISHEKTFHNIFLISIGLAGTAAVDLELAKKSEQCLEYIIVHEMIHLFERHHNEHFLALMNKIMPGWQLHRAELNRAPLGHVEWEY